MKFAHGAWQLLKGVTATPAKRVYDYRIEGNTLWLAALDRHGTGGADRFEGQILQLQVSSPMPDVLRVRVTHHDPKVTAASVPDYAINTSLQASEVRIQDSEDRIRFASGKLAVSFNKKNWDMLVEGDDALLTRGGGDSLAYMQRPEKDGGTHHLMQRLTLGVGEVLYGMGERFGPLTRNGQTVSIWNEDGGTTSDLSYKNIPFYLSSRGYGLMIATPGRPEFEVATERVSQVQFSIEGEELDYYLFYGPDPKAVLEKYTLLTGRPPLLPDWSYGLWLSTSFTTHYDEKTVTEFVDGMAARNIPLSVFHFDCFWMKERHWCDFEWDRQAFPDPEGMLKRLKAKGLKICLWINPYISQLSKLYAEGRDQGYLLRRPDGRPWQIDQWQPGMALVDFTNPAAVKWYQSKLDALLKMGVDTFKTDFAERIPTDVVYHDGSDPVAMHNHYTFLYNKAVFDIIEKHQGKGNAMVFARSATLGSQQFAVHWGGDCEASFESMAEDLRGGLSFCTSGPAFWSHDIGGFTGKAPASVYKRWAAFGLLSSHSRLHGSESYRVPWLFDEESVSVLRYFTRLKNRLSPYLLAAARDAHEHGWPVMRAMHLEFPHDPTCLHLDRQYMLGDSLLVAPVFHDSLAEYYLPPLQGGGEWTHLLTGESIPGGRWIKEELSFLQLPLFVRPNTILPMTSNELHPGWKAGDPLTLHLHGITPPPTPTHHQSLRLMTSTGEGPTITLRHDDDALILTASSELPNLSVRHGETTIPWFNTRVPLTLAFQTAS